jgi:hypothetical protein
VHDFYKKNRDSTCTPSDAHKRKLEEPGLHATGLDDKPLLLDTATDIAKEAIKKVLELENKPKTRRQTRGYSGVGQRVRTVMKKAYLIQAKGNITTLAEPIRMGTKTTWITDFNS